MQPPTAQQLLHWTAMGAMAALGVVLMTPVLDLVITSSKGLFHGFW